MKYTNILGKDFKYKKDAKEYFNSILYSIKRPGRDNHITFTEETLIKQSHVKSLYNNYLTRRLLWKDDFLRKFLKTGEYLGSDSVFECDKCKCHKKIEVHHVTPFNDIFDEWRENVWKEDLFPDSACSSFSAEANESWCQFHHNVVVYQKLCKSCHTKETYGRD